MDGDEEEEEFGWFGDDDLYLKKKEKKKGGIVEKNVAPGLVIYSRSSAFLGLWGLKHHIIITRPP